MLIVSEVNKSIRKPFDVSVYRDTSPNMIEWLTTRSTIPAVTHVDYSARLQTVHPEDNEVLYDLLSQFEKITGCATMINTSFNVGENLCHEPRRCYKMFLSHEIDLLVLENHLLWKKQQPIVRQTGVGREFELD